MKILETIGYYTYYLHEGYVYRIEKLRLIPVMPYNTWLRRMAKIEEAKKVALK
jgi:hypothetical protein